MSEKQSIFDKLLWLFKGENDPIVRLGMLAIVIGTIAFLIVFVALLYSASVTSATLLAVVGMYALYLLLVLLILVTRFPGAPPASG